MAVKEFKKIETNEAQDALPELSQDALKLLWATYGPQSAIPIQANAIDTVQEIRRYVIARAQG